MTTPPKTGSTTPPTRSGTIAPASSRGTGRRGLYGLLAVGAVALAVAAGCSATAGSSAGMSLASPSGAAGQGVSAAAGSATAEAAPTRVASADEPSAGGVASGGTAGTAGTQPLVDDRQIIRTASLSLRLTVPRGEDAEATTKALARAAADAGVAVRAVATGAGGYVSAADGGGATISVTLRVPVGDYEAVMTRLAAVGTVTSRTEKTDDVTDEMIDVSSRLDTMRASVARVRELLTKADKIGDVIAIESELTQREADLESLENRRSALQGQAALSTVTVTVTAVTEGAAAPQPVDRSGFLAGLASGWRALTSIGTGVAALVGAVLPFAPVAVVAALILLWLRRRRHAGAGPVSAPSDGASAAGQ